MAKYPLWVWLFRQLERLWEGSDASELEPYDRQLEVRALFWKSSRAAQACLGTWSLGSEQHTTSCSPAEERCRATYSTGCSWMSRVRCWGRDLGRGWSTQWGRQCFASQPRCFPLWCLADLTRLSAWQIPRFLLLLSWTFIAQRAFMWWLWTCDFGTCVPQLDQRVWRLGHQEEPWEWHLSLPRFYGGLIRTWEVVELATINLVNSKPSALRILSWWYLSGPSRTPLRRLCWMRQRGCP